MLDFSELFSKIVSSCKKCSGRGIRQISPTIAEACDCLKFYMFIVKAYTAGVPYNYIFDFKEQKIPENRLIYIFADDKRLFDLAMTFISKGYRVIVLDASLMSQATLYIYDVLVIYNIGLEENRNSPNTLERLIKFVSMNNLYGIFGFSFQRQKLTYLYPQSICQYILKQK